MAGRRPRYGTPDPADDRWSRRGPRAATPPAERVPLPRQGKISLERPRPMGVTQERPLGQKTGGFLGVAPGRTRGASWGGGSGPGSGFGPGGPGSDAVGAAGNGVTGVVIRVGGSNHGPARRNGHAHRGSPSSLTVWGVECGIAGQLPSLVRARSRRHRRSPATWVAGAPLTPPVSKCGAVIFCPTIFATVECWHGHQPLPDPCLSAKESEGHARRRDAPSEAVPPQMPTRGHAPAEAGPRAAGPGPSTCAF